MIKDVFPLVLLLALVAVAAIGIRMTPGNHPHDGILHRLLIPGSAIRFTSAVVCEAFRYYDSAAERYHQLVVSDWHRLKMSKLQTHCLQIQANRYFLRGQYDQALAHYRQALAINNLDYFGLLGLGLSFQNNGQFEAALNTFREAVERRPESHDPWVAMANLQFLSGNRKAAFVSYRNAQKASPGDAYIPLNAGLAYLERGEISKARCLIENALHLQNRLPEAHLRLAWVMLHRPGDSDRAIHHIRVAQQLKPNHPDLPILLKAVDTVLTGNRLPGRFTFRNRSMLNEQIVPPWKILLEIQLPENAGK